MIGRRSLPALLGTSAIACADDPEPFSPTPWEYEEAEAPLEPLAVERVEEALAEALDTVLTLDALDVFEAVEEARALGDDACPEVTDFNGQVITRGDCTSSTGYSYYGFALTNRLQGTNNMHDGDPEPYYHDLYRWCTGVLRVVGPDGYVVEALGDSLYREYVVDGDDVLEMRLTGDFYATGPDTPAPWLSEQIGTSVSAVVALGAKGRVSVWNGGMSTLGGLVTAAVFESFVVSEEAGGCAIEPTGAVELLDRQGVWYTVSFDGDTACDGLGVASFEGGELGAVAVDVTRFVDWEGRPW